MHGESVVVDVGIGVLKVASYASHVEYRPDPSKRLAVRKIGLPPGQPGSGDSQDDCRHSSGRCTKQPVWKRWGVLQQNRAPDNDRDRVNNEVHINDINDRNNITDVNVVLRRVHYSPTLRQRKARGMLCAGDSDSRRRAQRRRRRGSSKKRRHPPTPPLTTMQQRTL